MNKTNLQKTIGIMASLLCSFHATAAPPLDPSKIDDKVTITLGQKLTVQFQAQGDSLKTPKIVEQTDQKQPSVILDFDKHDETLILHIKNGFAQTLRVRCLMRLKWQKAFSETSILSIPAGLGDFESWRDPIEELVLFDFKLSSEKSQ
jgi:hypothetical protein